ncbi:MAG: ADYC domain-containing protein [Phenylobacterium sp.]|uniref:ADYC domain-containing protein n=1 Tax=Phenylobacterium sp. TaxID=1871053 RepID=UPI00391A6BC3
MRMLLALIAATAIPLADARAESGPGITVVGTQFLVAQPDGSQLSSPELAGRILDIEGPDGAAVKVRIDSVTPAAERPSVLLHAFSVLDEASGRWRPACIPDAKGRRAGFPVAGAWDARDRYVKDSARWFLTCTSGSQGKCVLWGYDPWSRGPNGEDLAPHYQACQFMARADYDSGGTAFTRDGTVIYMTDAAGVNPRFETGDGLDFEAGWGPDGAVCIARFRWPDLLTQDAVLALSGRITGPCEEHSASARGGLIFSYLRRVAP